MDKEEIIPFIEPIYRFCHQRLNNWHDAEDLAGEILLHILDGAGKYRVESPKAWVWRIAHNRYARFVEAQRKRMSILSCCVPFDMMDGHCRTSEQNMPDTDTREEYEPVFAALHTLSAQYRDIFVDYYIKELSVKQLAVKYALPETTVKWRLNVGRNRVRERVKEENRMDKIYQRIHWDTTGCNGSMDSDKYLHTQIARAICLAAYEMPLTVEEISLGTGIPALYIEDELSRLEYGDAVRKTGNKYATDFIIFRLRDRADTEAALEPMVQEITDYYEKLLWGGGQDVRALPFYGSSFGMERLGYLLLPYLLRQKIEALKKNRLHLANGDFPPRKDGGCGWFIVPETADERETVGAYSTGCYVYAVTDAEGRSGESGHLYYYWIQKYYDRSVCQNRGIAWLGETGILAECAGGVLPDGRLAKEDIAQLLRNNLIRKEGDGYRLDFACFRREEFVEFCSLYTGDDERLDELLSRFLLSVRGSFERFVPRRLHSQINQWLSVYCGEIIGQVAEELIRRGKLRKPEPENTKPLTDGVFYIEGEFMLV